MFKADVGNVNIELQRKMFLLRLKCIACASVFFSAVVCDPYCGCDQGEKRGIIHVLNFIYFEASFFIVFCF